MANETDSPTWQSERETSGGMSVSAPLQHLRNYINPSSNGQNVGEHQLRLETIEQEISLRSNVLERQRRDLDNHPQTQPQDQDQDQGTATVPENVPASSSPSSLVRSRRRAFRSNERLQRHRERYNQAVRVDTSDTLGSVRRATPPPTFSEAMTDELGTEIQANREQRYRAKRRKLDDGTFDDETRVISYGDEGRVTPGPLQMEIVRCEGGDYFDLATSAHTAQFILHDDQNVYRTKEHMCSILFKHKGGMPFSLTKVVIKGTSASFDPLEGMIFVGMTNEQLLKQTSPYDKYTPRSYQFHHPYRRHDYYRPSQEYLNSTRSPLRSIDRSRYLRDPQPMWPRYVENDPELETSVIPGLDVSVAEPSDQEDTCPLTPRSPTTWRDVDADYSFRPYGDRYRSRAGDNGNRDDVSLTSSESEDEYEPPYRYRGTGRDDLDEELAQHRRRLNNMRIAFQRDLEAASSDLPSGRRPQQDRRTTEHSTPRPTSRRPGLRSAGDLSDATETRHEIPSKTTADSTSGHVTSTSTSDVPAPHARFALTERQGSIAVKFDPPVAGRYVLVKLWASCPSSTIDIQYILLHGYGGPRFFPSVEAR